MRRVLRYDGLLPVVIGAGGERRKTTARHIREMRAFVEANRTEATSFDIIMEGKTPGDDAVKAARIVRPWAKAGVTWWIEAMWDVLDKSDRLKITRRRIRQGPPALS